MGNIVVLDELTINKIAAGEVIERPASVIKEMVENSIDAGAKNISVDVKNGGISYIRISDDGKGIDKEDLELAFERHATSKIRQADDLNEVKSMGFRGEALASIAAVAKVEMISKTENADIGNKIVVEGGDVKEFAEIGAPKGTTITVQELFFNTPVRYKFLKKDYTEAGYIEDVITRLALVHPDITFKLTNSGKTIIQTNGDGNIKNVIYSIYGKIVATACLNVNYEFEGIKITGAVGKPEIARSNRGNQLFFINKRYIRDRILTNSAEKAYKGMIPIGKFGFLILDLEMSPSLVDVNVHPAKLEVRFQEEQKVFKAVYYAIQDTLLKAELIANSETPITGKLEKDNLEGEDMEEDQKSTISGLFRKIAKNADDYDTTNVIESIYRSKNGGLDVEGVQNTNSLEEEKKLENNENQKKEENDYGESYNSLENTKLNDNHVSSYDYSAGNNTNSYSSLSNNTYNASAEPDIENKEAIKNTINEFMKMGKDLTAEQIREKLSKVAEESAKKAEEEAVKKLELENSRSAGIEDTNKGPSGIEAVGGIGASAGSTAMAGLGIGTGFTPATNTFNSQNATTTTSNSWSSLYTLTGNQNNQKSEVSGETQKYEIPVENKEENKPGDVLLSILQDRDKKEMIPSVPKGQFDDMYAQIFGNKAKEAESEENKEQNTDDANDIANTNLNLFEDSEEFQGQIPYNLIGIAFKTYIILEIKDQLYILDQHAAHERIMYEKVKKNYYSDENKDSQLMLLPDIITLTHKEMDIARENMDKFEKAGFVLEEFGENTIKLTGVPNICLDLDTKELFLETLDEINTVARTAKQEIEEKFIATIACKAAVKANMALTNEEVKSLLEELLALPNPFTCPHGRPTAIKLSKMDIEKKFARRK